MPHYNQSHSPHNVRAKILKLLELFFETNFPLNPKQTDDEKFHQDVKKSLEELQEKYGHKDYHQIEPRYIPRLSLRIIKKIFKWHT